MTHLALGLLALAGVSMSDSPPTRREWALRYAELGWRVFPCMRGTKKPMVKWSTGKDAASTDPEYIRKWWPIVDDDRTPNIAIATGEGSGLVTTDLDIKEGVDGTRYLPALRRLYGSLDDACIVRTPRRGLHVHAGHPCGGDHVGNKQGVLLGVDVRGDGGYVLAPPSHTADGAYAWEQGPFIPGLMYRPLSAPDAPRPQWTPPVHLADHDAAEKRARAYVERMPIAVSGSGGHMSTWRAALACHSFGLDTSATYRVLRDVHNPRCEPPWSERELWHKAEQACGRSKAPSGWRLIEGGKSLPGPGNYRSNPPLDARIRGVSDETVPDDDNPFEPCENPAVNENRGSVPEAFSGSGKAPVVSIGTIDKAPHTTPPIGGVCGVGSFYWQSFRAEHDRRRAEGLSAIASPLPGLDRATGGGLHAAAVTLLCGPPGVGKSSLALGWGTHSALSGTPALIWSLEMPGFDIGCRLVCQWGGASVSWADLRVGQHPDAVAVAAERLESLPIAYHDRTSVPTLEALRHEHAVMCDQYGRVVTLIVDYAQLVKTAEREGEARSAASQASQMLLSLALTTGAPVLALSAVGRGKYAPLKSDGRPDLVACLSAAKESGQFESDAATVIAIVMHPGGAERRGWLCVAKSRLGGDASAVPVIYQGQRGVFVETTEDQVINAPDQRDMVERVLEIVRRHGPNSKTHIAKLMGGRTQDALRAVDAATDAGLIYADGKRYRARESDA